MKQKMPQEKKITIGDDKSSSHRLPIVDVVDTTDDNNNLVKIMKDNGLYYPVGYINWKTGKLTPI